jgi:uncharacterized protein YndB with AHSA1/START domain
VSELFTNNQVIIDAPAARVWDVLTKPGLTMLWVGHFQSVFASLESGWQVGNAVYWRTPDGKTLVDGKVTLAARPDALSFTVHDLSGKFDAVRSDRDGIFYTLDQQNDHTRLQVTQGDFAKMGKDAKIYYDSTTASWAGALPQIKHLAELPDR